MAADQQNNRQAVQKQWTVLDLLNWTKQFFENKDIDSPRLAAELLLAHVLEWERIQLYTKFDYVVPPDKRAAYRELVSQRAAHRPMQYILGKCEFYSLEFRVNESVLVPRPETEHLVEALIQRAKELAEPKVLDIGTGSGCIPVAAAVHLPEARFTTVDISPEALEVARQNAEKHGVADRISFQQGDLFEPVGQMHFDFIVSNPPYISESEYALLMPEVKDHEPRTALLAGADGLDAYRRIIEQAVGHLEPGGRLLLEMPAGKSREIREIACTTPLIVEEIIPDYQGIERVLILSFPGKETVMD